jgi:hypothetical protein
LMHGGGSIMAKDGVLFLKNRPKLIES